MLSYSFGPQLERPSIGRKLASRLRAPKSILFVWPLILDSYFLQILTQTSACFRCVTSSALCHPVSSRTVMTSEWHLHPLAHTRVNTCFNLTPNQLMCWAEKAWTEIPRLFHNMYMFIFMCVCTDICVCVFGMISVFKCYFCLIWLCACLHGSMNKKELRNARNKLIPPVFFARKSDWLIVA